MTFCDRGRGIMGFLSDIRAREDRRLAAQKAASRNMEHSVDPVRDHTSGEVQARIDTQTYANIRYFADKSSEELTRRIEELDREWTLDRALMSVVAGASLSGIALSRFSGPRWILLPVVGALFLLEHVLEGWFVSASLFRKMGFRTDREVQFEKYALRLLRGDFTIISEGDEGENREKLTAELLRTPD